MAVDLRHPVHYDKLPTLLLAGPTPTVSYHCSNYKTSRFVKHPNAPPPILPERLSKQKIMLRQTFAELVSNAMKVLAEDKEILPV